MSALQLSAEILTRRRAFAYRHVVTLEETNAMGNVYFTRHVMWQGRCRELFLREHARTVFDDITKDLRLVTLNVACEYYHELRADDEVRILMTLAHVRNHRIGLHFHYGIDGDASRAIVAEGTQEIACMRMANGTLSPTAVPGALADALKRSE